MRCASGSLNLRRTKPPRSFKCNSATSRKSQAERNQRVLGSRRIRKQCDCWSQVAAYEKIDRCTSGCATHISGIERHEDVEGRADSTLAGRAYGCDPGRSRIGLEGLFQCGSVATFFRPLRRYTLAGRALDGGKPHEYRVEEPGGNGGGSRDYGLHSSTFSGLDRPHTRRYDGAVGALQAGPDGRDRDTHLG